jgi:hypothetical protein
MVTLRDVFEPLASNGLLLIADGVSVELNTFLDLFNGAEPTYESLMQSNGNKGYEAFIESCKEKEIIA